MLGLEPEDLLDEELAALALGVSLREARAWLSDRGEVSAARITIEQRREAMRALDARIAPRPSAAPVISSVAAAVALLAPVLARLEVEELHVLGLDARNRVVGRRRIARGAVNQVMATAREVFRPLLLFGAARAIIAHNHPSGDPSPSEADTELTVRLGVAGELIGVPIIDHLILARTGHHSYAEAGNGLISPSAYPTMRKPRRRGNVGHGIGIG